MLPNEKACPFCAETIKSAAIKCKYCGSMLAEGESLIAAAAPPIGELNGRQGPLEANPAYQAQIGAEIKQQTAPPKPFSEIAARNPKNIYPDNSKKYYSVGLNILTFVIAGVGQLCLGQVALGVIFLVADIVFACTGYGLLLSLIVSVNSAYRYYQDARILDSGKPIRKWTGADSWTTKPVE